MAVTCRDIIRRALRKLSRVAAGADVSGTDAVDALETLQAIYMELAGNGLFGKLLDVVVTTGTYIPREQDRVNCQNPSGVTVTLPDLIDPKNYTTYPDGYPANYVDFWSAEQQSCGYDYGFGIFPLYPRPPRDGACIAIVDLYSNTSKTWVYDSNTARWVQLEALNLTDGAPLAGRYSDGIACLLASRIAPEYAMAVPAEVAAGASRGIYAMTHRNDAIHQPTRAEYF